MKWELPSEIASEVEYHLAEVYWRCSDAAQAAEAAVVAQERALLRFVVAVVGIVVDEWLVVFFPRWWLERLYAFLLHCVVAAGTDDARLLVTVAPRPAVSSRRSHV